MRHASQIANLAFHACADHREVCRLESTLSDQARIIEDSDSGAQIEVTPEMMMLIKTSLVSSFCEELQTFWAGSGYHYGYQSMPGWLVQTLASAAVERGLTQSFVATKPRKKTEALED